MKRRLAKIFASLWLLTAWANGLETPTPATPSPAKVFVVRAVDGDTLVINVAGREDRVRMIGVDTPELHHPTKPVQCFAQEAWLYTQARVENREVLLTFDPANDSVGHRDKYRRLLAYVYLADRVLHNADLIRQGYGFAYLRFPYRFSQDFAKLEAEAKAAGRGLWSRCPQPEELRDNSLNAEEEVEIEGSH